MTWTPNTYIIPCRTKGAPARASNAYSNLESLEAPLVSFYPLSRVKADLFDPMAYMLPGQNLYACI